MASQHQNCFPGSNPSARSARYMPYVRSMPHSAPYHYTSSHENGPAPQNPSGVPAPLAYYSRPLINPGNIQGNEYAFSPAIIPSTPSLNSTTVVSREKPAGSSAALPNYGIGPGGRMFSSTAQFEVSPMGTRHEAPKGPMTQAMRPSQLRTVSDASTSTSASSYQSVPSYGGTQQSPERGTVAANIVNTSRINPRDPRLKRMTNKNLGWGEGSKSISATTTVPRSQQNPTSSVNSAPRPSTPFVTPAERARPPPPAEQQPPTSGASGSRPPLERVSSTGSGSQPHSASTNPVPRAESQPAFDNAGWLATVPDCFVPNIDMLALGFLPNLIAVLIWGVSGKVPGQMNQVHAILARLHTLACELLAAGRLVGCKNLDKNFDPSHIVRQALAAWLLAKDGPVSPQPHPASQVQIVLNLMATCFPDGDTFASFMTQALLAELINRIRELDTADAQREPQTPMVARNVEDQSGAAQATHETTSSRKVPVSGTRAVHEAPGSSFATGHAGPGSHVTPHTVGVGRGTKRARDESGTPSSTTTTISFPDTPPNQLQFAHYHSPEMEARPMKRPRKAYASVDKHSQSVKNQF